MAEKNSKDPRAKEWVILLVLIALVVWGIVVTNPEHLWGLASSAEYRRCWKLAEPAFPDGWDVFDIESDDDRIKWTAKNWDGDQYRFSARICRRGADRVEGSALN